MILKNLLKQNKVEEKKIEEYVDLTKRCIYQDYFKFGGKYYGPSEGNSPCFKEI